MWFRFKIYQSTVEVSVLRQFRLLRQKGGRTGRKICFIILGLFRAKSGSIAFDGGTEYTRNCKMKIVSPPLIKNRFWIHAWFSFRKWFQKRHWLRIFQEWSFDQILSINKKYLNPVLDSWKAIQNGIFYCIQLNVILNFIFFLFLLYYIY